MVTPVESDKARGYIQQLDEARCAGRWTDVPELCRKVEKHAPHRKCLSHTARSEAQIAAYSAQRPSTAASTSTSTGSTSNGLSQMIPSLLTAIEEHRGTAPKQDVFQATVCLGWLHYVLDEPGLAIARLPKDLGEAASDMAAEGAPVSAWSKVCLAKGTYLKGSAQEKTGSVGDATATYSSIVPWLAASTVHADSPQSKAWTENLLVRLCQLSDQSGGHSEYVSHTEALRTYRYWAQFWEATAKGGQEATSGAHERRTAWKAYYDTLSAILRQNLAYEPDMAPSTSEKSSAHSQSSLRLRQRAELKRVETIYETLLINETDFPKASESNHEIEAWVDSVMDNWRALCGPTWSNSDLGEGGKEGVGRGVLDILYRAATKTFHSTQILRCLFIVHASLAEFDLAFKAFDSYVEIITRGKDRAERSGEVDMNIDGDGTVLRTSAQAVRLLCRFGGRKEAEKAHEIGHNIEKWMEQSEHIHTTSESGSVASTETQVAALAVAYSAIGISQAQWARYTFEAEKRAGYQAQAIQYLRKSLSPGLGDSNNVKSLYALALVLAETRDIPNAIKTVKRALSPAAKATAALSLDGVLSDGLTGEYARERKLIPLWHLLALLLTSRSDYVAAEKACEAAFEQFGGPSVLFGKDAAGSFQSDHLNQANGKEITVQGIVDRMEGFEKHSILHIKMTQLSLIETTNGPNAAVDGCDELLALYSRLFGDPTRDKPQLEPPPTTLIPPKSAVGTIRGSIFRGRGSVKTTPNDASARNSSVLSSKASSTVASQPGAPAIQVTDDGGAANPNSHHHHLFHHSQKHEENQSGVARTPSKLQKRSASLRRQSVSDAGQTPEVPLLPENGLNGSPTQKKMLNSPQRSAENNDRALRSIPHNMPHAYIQQPPEQDVRLPTAFPNVNYIPPDPHFSQLQTRRQKVSLLVDIWIFISGLYTRATMFEDAKEAIVEAIKLVETFEAEVSHESSTAKALAERGCGGGKSVEELWADVYTARGALLVAQSSQHEARTDFERALLHFPDHPQGIVGLSNILLDIYSEVIPLEPTKQTVIFTPPVSVPSVPKHISDHKIRHLKSLIPSVENHLLPPELTRLGSRDRAFGLLSTLTKLDAGWDYSEAWYALARAYELSGQIDKTKEVLWWCVELEDTHPIRSWKTVTLGGFVL